MSSWAAQRTVTADLSFWACSGLLAVEAPSKLREAWAGLGKAMEMVGAVEEAGSLDAWLESLGLGAAERRELAGRYLVPH